MANAQGTPSLPNYATNIALIKDGVVENIIWGMFYGKDSYISLGYDEAVAYDMKAVQIGYTYLDGVFYDTAGNPVKTIMEKYEEEIEELDNFIIEALYEDIINDLDEFEE